MIYIDDQQVSELLHYAELVDALETAFRKGGEIPLRQHYSIDVPAGENAHLLLMPAWQSEQKIGVKIVTVFPDNATTDIATVNASYLLLDANTGLPEAILAGTELTRRRTAAASALAARYLARQESKRLLMVGTGNLSTHLINAHCSNHPIEVVQIWGRRYERACLVAEQFVNVKFDVEPVVDLEEAVSSADIISCATLSKESLICGDWLLPGQHLDLVGSFTPEMREVDDSTLQLADIYVDTRDGALREAGELVQAMHHGLITNSDILGDLFDLTRGICKGRLSDERITLFKSVGTALEDLVAAELVVAKIETTSV